MELNSVIHSAASSESVYFRPANPTNPPNRQNNSISANTLESLNNKPYTPDRLSLSKEGKKQAARSDLSPDTEESSKNDTPNAISQEDMNLSEHELAQLSQLKKRDIEVRAHEQAHLSAAGQYARGGASFTYQRGPDGGSYAIGGEVGIDISKESTPEATIFKMRTIKRAALAPANPSGTDKRIAAQAGATEAQARQQLLQIKQEELLRGESNSEIPSKNPADQPPTFSGSGYGSLKAKLAVYEQISSMNRPHSA